jgi:hypothetical protein
MPSRTHHVRTQGPASDTSAIARRRAPCGNMESMARSEESTRHSSVPIDLTGPEHWPARRSRRRIRRLLRVLAPAAGAALLLVFIAQLLR